jgi:Serine/Threonine/Tyrosine Kinase found in polyvalent proteins
MNNGHTETLRRAIETANGNLIQTALIQLRTSKTAGRKIEKPKLVSKENEVEILIQWADKGSFWVDSIKKENYIGEGAEQRVYLDDDGKFVIKTNDDIFLLIMGRLLG